MHSEGRLIGLTGKRGVGKSEVTKLLVDMGYTPIHAFAPGKAATVALFEFYGADTETAMRMVHGDLKDVPSDLLPGRCAPRHWMERFGHFMGVEMGPEWTLGPAIAQIRRQSPSAWLVAESIVYEAPLFRALGGKIYRVTRPDVDGPVGAHTDAAQAGIEVDDVIVNDGSLADLHEKVLHLFS